MPFYRAKDLILYEDRDLVVCQKPAGLPVQSKKLGQMDLESLLKNELALREPGKMPYLGVIHRLDQPVEGITLFAKNQKAAAALSTELQQGRMTKEYLAVTEAAVSKPEGELVDWLKKEARTNTSMVVSKGTPGAKRADLTYRVLEVQEQKTLLQIQLGTGRHHQIRVQMAHAGMPLAGDRKYNSQPTALPAVALCAWRLSFVHPTTHKKMTFCKNPQGAAFSGFVFCQNPSDDKM